MDVVCSTRGREEKWARNARWKQRSNYSEDRRGLECNVEKKLKDKERENV